MKTPYSLGADLKSLNIPSRFEMAHAYKFYFVGSKYNTFSVNHGIYFQYICIPRILGFVLNISCKNC